MKKITRDSQFKILDVCVYVQSVKGWTLLTEFKNGPFSDGADRYRLEHIRDNEYWLWDSTDAIIFPDDYKLRLKIRVTTDTQ